MKLYAFDVDETLEVSGGPILMERPAELHNLGHVVGLCGNWAVVVRGIPAWFQFISFLGPMEITKADFLRQLKTYIPSDEYIMVGNVLGVSGQSDDKGAADEAGWRFIQEQAFADGER